MPPAPTPAQTEAETWFQRGSAAQAEGRLDEAVACFDRATSLNAGHFAACFARGMALHDLHRFEEAAASYGQAAGLASQSPDLYLNRGAMWLDAEQYEAALADFDRALALRRNFPQAQINRGNALKALGRLEEALVTYDRLLANHPAFAAAHNNRGNVLQELDRPEEALAAYERAVRLDPAFANAWNNRGNVLRALGRHEDAIEAYDRLLDLAPGFAPGHIGRGNALRALRRHDDAVTAYERAIALRPRDGEAWIQRGVALHEMRRFAEAVDSFDQALAVDADRAEAWIDRGRSLEALDRHAEAIDSYDQALARRPDLPWVAGLTIHRRLEMADWDGWPARRAALAEAIAAGHPAAYPLAVQAVIDDPALQRRAAETLVGRDFPMAAKPMSPSGRADGRIRIGYVSSDFGDHAVGHRLAGVLEAHDRARFEILAFSLSGADEGPWRTRIAAAVDRFVDLSAEDDATAVERVRAYGIDIAVDLNGFTEGGRPALFAARLAPVQASYLGYAGTTGAAWIDYLIADPVLVPEAQTAFYSEKIAVLPFSLANAEGPVAGAVPARADLGLPDRGFVFCAFNDMLRLTPEVFASWMHILSRVPGSVLWLYAGRDAAMANLRQAAKAARIDPARLVFADRLPPQAHLARLKQADVFLDTAPCNAGAIAGDALRSGVPVVTQAGRSMAGRTVAGFLHAVGMRELVTTTADAYEDLAVALATDPTCLSLMRRKLAGNLPKARLFDTAAGTRALEAAFTEMHRRAREGLPPDHIRV